MKRVLPALFVLLFVVSFSTKGQYQSRYWKTMRYDVFGGIGTNVFMGDLGGGKGEGVHFFGVRDFDIQTTRPTVSVGGRMKLRQRMALKGIISYARINGNDKNSANNARFIRNLSFSSNIWEGSLCLEISILKENRGKRYIFQKRSILNNMNIYFFGGIGALHYEPKVKYEGSWVKLREMHTGGQGLAYGDGEVVKEYKPWALAFPVGIGLKYYLDKHWSIGTELGIRYTNTDYLDDASGRYFDNDLIKQVYGEQAAALADRHIPQAGEEELVTEAGKYPHDWWQRGDTKFNDAYLFFLVTATYTFQNRAKYGPKYQ